MAKFVMECPACGSYMEVYTGIFAKKKINCTCGHIIDVKTEKMISRKCVHCGNTVVFDQSNREKAICPVCHNKINTMNEISSLAEFTCPSCSCKLSADKNAEKYTCPLCDTVIDVQERIEKEKIKNQGFASVIKYKGTNDVLVWKHPIEDFSLGSQLIVHESQEAIFFRDGKALDLFGAGRYTLATQNLPMLKNIYKLPLSSDTAFHSEVYFINMTTQMGIKWGTDTKVRFFDPGSGLHIEVGAFGNFNLKVNDSRKLLLKLVGTADILSQEEIVGSEGSCGTKNIIGKFKGLIINVVKSNLAKVIKTNNINILEVDEHIDELSLKLRDIINSSLDEYGLFMPEFYIISILTPDDDLNFKRLKQQFADKTLKVREEDIKKAEAEAAKERKLVEAQTAAQLKIVGAQGEAEALKLKAQAEAEAYKLQAYAEAEGMRVKGYTYQQETARQVGLEAMQNGITGGGSGTGIGDIAGLGVTLGAIGGVIGLTKEAFNPIMNNSVDIGVGMGNIVAGKIGVWECSCGVKGITSNFCPNCGAKSPELKMDTWDCPKCGAKDVTSKFCPECGEKKPENDTWNCSCGTKEIKTKFCPECGKGKEEQ